MPPITYPIEDSLPNEAITSGNLSSLQLEGIIYAVSMANELKHLINIDIIVTFEELHYSKVLCMDVGY